MGGGASAQLSPEAYRSRYCPVPVPAVGRGEKGVGGKLSVEEGLATASTVGVGAPKGSMAVCACTTPRASVLLISTMSVLEAM